MTEDFAEFWVILMKVACAATWENGDVQVHSAVEDHVWVHGPIAAKVFVDVHGPW